MSAAAWHLRQKADTPPNRGFDRLLRGFRSFNRAAIAAREIGTFTFMTKGANPKEVTGKFVVVWEKSGSDWKLAADIWNEGK
jgi:hypothetical protein